MKRPKVSNDSIEKEKVNESECVITKECYLENEITDSIEDGTVKPLNAIKEFKILKDAIDKEWLKLNKKRIQKDLSVCCFNCK